MSTAASYVIRIGNGMEMGQRLDNCYVLGTADRQYTPDPGRLIYHRYLIR